MAALTTCSDLGAQENTVSPSICREVMGPVPCVQSHKKCKPLCVHVQLRLVKVMLLSQLSHQTGTLCTGCLVLHFHI